MTVRFWTDARIKHYPFLNSKEDEKSGEYYFDINDNPGEIKLQHKVKKLIQCVSWYWLTHSQDTVLHEGFYEGNRWKAEVSKDTLVGRPCYSIRGTFENLDTLTAFRHELLYGNLQPTLPLGGVPRQDVNAYRKRASLAVANSAKIIELQSTVHQLQNHIAGLQQLIQDHVLTPQK